jgi:hypothetical protein
MHNATEYLCQFGARVAAREHPTEYRGTQILVYRLATSSRYVTNQHCHGLPSIQCG